MSQSAVGDAASIRPLRIALVAGEASGDLLGAELIEALRQRWPDAHFAGVAGERMREAGCEAWWPADALAVMGLAEVLRHLPRLLALRRQVRRRLLDWRPDVFVGIDAPDFNLPLERMLRRQGITTVHYVSPSVWAWRAKRAARLGTSARRVLCLFPMEPSIYAQHGVDAVFVGHPLADRAPLAPDRDAARERLGVPLDVPVLALLPGSRLGEIDRLAPIFLDATAQLLANPSANHKPEPVGATPVAMAPSPPSPSTLQIPDLTKMHIIVPLADARTRQRFQSVLADKVTRSQSLARLASENQLHLVERDTGNALIAADVALLASGTAALEALLARRPTVIAYIVAPLTAWLVRRFGLIKSPYFSLPNVLADEELMPELLQEACTAERIAASLREQLGLKPAELARFEARCDAIHRSLRCNASERAADAVSALLSEAKAPLATG